MSLNYNKLLASLAGAIEGFDTRELENQEAILAAHEDIAGGEVPEIGIFSSITQAFMKAEEGGVSQEDIGDQDLIADKLNTAKKLVMKALKPVEGLKSSLNRKSVIEDIKASMEDYGEVIEVGKGFDLAAKDEKRMVDSVVAMEDYSTVDVKKSIFFTVAFNAITKTQDDVVELFFPTVHIDPNIKQAFVEVDVVHFVKPSKRLPNGKPINYKSTPYIKSLENLQEFVIDGNRLFPILRVNGTYVNTDYLLNVPGTSRVVETIKGAEVTTAPIKTGVKVDILGISQTDDLISNGFMTELNNVEPTLNIKALYYKVTGKDKNGNVVTEYLRKDIGGIPLAFVETNTGSVLSMLLSETRILMFQAPIITVEGKKTSIKALADITDGYYVRFNTNLKGDANIDEGWINVNEFEHEVLGVYDADGNKLPDSDYTDAINVFKTSILVGYDLEAYGNNDMAAYEGKRLNMSKYVFVFNIPARVKVSEKTPPFQLGTYKHPKGLYALVNYSQQVLTAHGFTTLFNFINAMDHLDNDTTNFGVANFMVDKYKKEYSLDVVKLVNSLKSSERLADIQAAFELYVKNLAWDMYNKSNYKFAFSEYYPDQKPTVIIGVSIRIAQYFQSFEDDTFKYVVKASKYDIMNDKMILSFGIMDSTRNTAANPLNFGVCFVRPETVLTFQVRESKKKFDESIVILGFKHQPLLPIVSIVNVSRLAEAVKSLPVYTSEVTE